jgi:hypothetical protein
MNLEINLLLHITNHRTMDNVQNCDSYINIPSSQTYISNLLLRYELSVALFVFNKQNDVNKTFVHLVSHLNGTNFGKRDALLASTAFVVAAAGKAEGGGWVTGTSAFLCIPATIFLFLTQKFLFIFRLSHSAVVPPDPISSSQTISLHNLAMLYTFCLC